MFTKYPPPTRLCWLRHPSHSAKGHVIREDLGLQAFEVLAEEIEKTRADFKDDEALAKAAINTKGRLTKKKAEEQAAKTAASVQADSWDHAYAFRASH